MTVDSKRRGDHSRPKGPLAPLLAALALVALLATAVVLGPRPASREETPAISGGGSPASPDGGRGGTTRADSLVASVPFMRGVCWEAAGRIDPSDLDPLARVRANWISQTPFGWQRRLDSPSIRVSNGWGGYWGESDTGIEATTRWARERGIRVLLKPHIWTHAGWSGAIEMKSEGAWRRWFEDYRTFILHYADLAERCGIEALAVGTELGGTTRHEREWRAIIAEIRAHYGGALVYCANWAEDRSHVRFWDALDWIGVQAYYPLSRAREPSVEELLRSWKKPLAELTRFSERWGKPVVLTEVGYHSLDTAASRPWEWDLHGRLSLATQARCYGALFRALPDHPRVRGVFIWKWHPDYARAGGPEDTEYTPERKPAEAVLARAFEEIKRRDMGQE